jgi:hypothetical protein
MDARVKIGNIGLKYESRIRMGHEIGLYISTAYPAVAEWRYWQSGKQEPPIKTRLKRPQNPAYVHNISWFVGLGRVMESELLVIILGIFKYSFQLFSCDAEFRCKRFIVIDE